jgi:hypothetical protein
MTDLVFNELSTRSLAANPHVARSRATRLTQIIAAARRSGVLGSFRIPINFFQLNLAAGYSFQSCLSDTAMPREERLYLRSQATAFPYLHDLPSIQAVLEVREFTLDETICSGLGVAYLISGLALSVLSEDRWNQASIAIRMASLVGDGDLVEVTVSVVHAAELAHIEAFSSEELNKTIAGLKTGTELWEAREAVLPRLDLVPALRESLATLRASEDKFGHVISRLLELNHYCEAWKEGPFSPSAITGRPTTESAATLERYGDERTFRCSDGQNRLFSWHVRVGVEGWRIHFFPVPEERKIIVGYVGKHLRTVIFG